MPNLELEEPEESHYQIKLCCGLWAHVFGGPFNEDEIRKLKEKYAQEFNDKKVKH